MPSTSFHIVPLAGAAMRFVASAVALLALLASFAQVARGQVPDESSGTARVRVPDTLRLVFVGTGGVDDPARLGARLGADEASRTARLFGRVVTMGFVGSADTALLAASAEQALAGGAAAIVSPCDEPALCLRLAAVAARRGGFVVNTGSGDDALRAASCSAPLFHVAPSAAMRRDAARLGGSPGAVAWLPTLGRYGAEQLNDRYRAATGGAMDERAWSAWVAVKIVAEASLRARSTVPDSIEGWLVRDDAQFDGHKGVPLSFRAWDRQLRQPLYLPANGTTTGPDGGATTVPAAGPGSPRARLDVLGAGRAETGCPPAGASKR